MNSIVNRSDDEDDTHAPAPAQPGKHLFKAACVTLIVLCSAPVAKKDAKKDKKAAKHAECVVKRAIRIASLLNVSMHNSSDDEQEPQGRQARKGM